MKRLVAALALAVGACSVGAAQRSSAERAAFKREHPCPSTGRPRGKCPGYVVDHVNPLCNGGPDLRSNMQWQSVREALDKDRWEREICRSRRHP